jgi:hypothetical protein
VKDEWLCDECVEFDDLAFGGFTFPKIDKPRQPFNPPVFVWGRKEKIA